MKKLVNYLLLTITFLMANSVQAGVVNGSGLISGEQINWYKFTTSQKGRVVINATETTKPASGIWDKAFDTALILFRDDGVLDEADFIEDGRNTQNGESMLSTLLSAGKYLLAVATHGASASPLPIAGGHPEHSYTDYTLQISGEFVNPAPKQVPEPGSLALFGLGLIGLAALSKRQQA